MSGLRKEGGTDSPKSGNVPHHHKNRMYIYIYIYIYGLVFFSRGPRYVLVEGGALAKHTPEAYPEAYPRSIPRSKPPK